MNISSILITGDDGYTSPRTRLLIRLLKDTYDLRVCATNTQQSGVGGYMSIREGGVWGEDAVDGVPALWVDKHPVDAIEVAEMYYQRTFDLVISGVNWGANLGGSVISSGTFAAGYRALHDRLAPHVMVLSWKVPFEMWFAIDQQETPIDSFLEYPGKQIVSMIHLAQTTNFWNTAMVNINFPEHPSNEVRWTTALPNLRELYPPLVLDREKKTFSYDRDPRVASPNTNPQFDSGAVQNGIISISKVHKDFTIDPIDEKQQSWTLI